MLRIVVKGLAACACVATVCGESAFAVHEPGCPSRTSQSSAAGQWQPNVPDGDTRLGLCAGQTGQEPWRGHDPESDIPTHSPRRPVVGISTGAPLAPDLYIGGY
jgi:hypothetical protein